MLFTINIRRFWSGWKIYRYATHLRTVGARVGQKFGHATGTNSSDSWIVYGRGVLHLSILIETMRREGYEFQVGQPRVIIKKIEGEDYEPVEQLTIDLPEEYSGKIIDIVTRRKGELLSMQNKGDRMHMEFTIPSRGIIGLNNIVLTLSSGEAIMSHSFL